MTVQKRYLPLVAPCSFRSVASHIRIMECRNVTREKEPRYMAETCCWLRRVNIRSWYACRVSGWYELGSSVASLGFKCVMRTITHRVRNAAGIGWMVSGRFSLARRVQSSDHAVWITEEHRKHNGSQFQQSKPYRHFICHHGRVANIHGQTPLGARAAGTREVVAMTPHFALFLQKTNSGRLAGLCNDVSSFR